MIWSWRNKMECFLVILGFSHSLLEFLFCFVLWKLAATLCVCDCEKVQVTSSTTQVFSPWRYFLLCVCVRCCVVCWGRGSTTVKTRAYDVKQDSEAAGQVIRQVLPSHPCAHLAESYCARLLPSLSPPPCWQFAENSFLGETVVILSFILKARTSAVTTRKKTRQILACRCVEWCWWWEEIRERFVGREKRCQDFKKIGGMCVHSAGGVLSCSYKQTIESHARTQGQPRPRKTRS